MKIISNLIDCIFRSNRKMGLRQLIEEIGLEFINCGSISDDYVEEFHHYFPLSRFEEMLNENKLTFVYPALWVDPYETLYLETNFSSVGKYQPPKVYCLCARTTNDNEQASWKVYSDGKELLIRVKFNFENLLRNIGHYAETNNCKIYYAKISYKLDYDKIKTIKDDITLRREYLMGFDEKKYIRLLSLKRPSFAYEKESRLFIVPQKDSSLINQKDNLIKVPIDNRVFERFVIEPMEKISKEDEGRLSSLIKKVKYESQEREIKNFVKRKKLSPKMCKHSVLYKDINPISKI